MQGLEGAVGLKVLALSFNELSSMEGLATLTRLTRLDLSFNAITCIQNLKVHANTVRFNILTFGRVIRQALLEAMWVAAVAYATCLTSLLEALYCLLKPGVQSFLK